MTSQGSSYVVDPALIPLADFLDEHTAEIILRAARAWDSTILLFAQLSEPQRAEILHLAEETIRLWSVRLRQDSGYARRVHELGQEWGAEAATWEFHVYSFTKAIDLLAHTTWEYLAEFYPMDHLSPATVFFLGRSRDQVLDDLRVPLLSTYMQRREIEMVQTRFTLQGSLSLPGKSLLLELGNRLSANKEKVVPSWIESVRSIPGSTEAMEKLLQQRGGALVDLLLSLLQSPTQETSEASLSNVRNIGLESAQAGVSFQEMFHALQQVRPILWDMIYEIYRREQYWHPAEFIEVLARLHLLLDLFSEGIGQAYLQQKQMIIQDQAEELHRRDLNVAREMLESLLPDALVGVEYTDVGTVWQPAREIGGDFFDIYQLDDGDVIFIMGDVSGKGISAALLVSMVKYVLKANAPLYRSPAALLIAANRFFYQDMGPELFVTLFIARYTPATGRLIYTNAGHEPALLCRSEKRQQTTKLPSQGPILGVLPEITLKDRRIWMRSGDILLLYTDGMVNMRCGGRLRENSASELCALARKHADLPAEALVRAMVDDSLRECETTDDITMLVVKRVGEEKGA